SDSEVVSGKNSTAISVCAKNGKNSSTPLFSLKNTCLSKTRVSLFNHHWGFINPFWGTHNGVLCVFDYEGNNLMLCNPSMYKFLRVPIPKYMDRGCERINVDDSSFAFWIDPSTIEFKLFIFTPILNADVTELLDVVAVLYSSTRRDWRLIPPPSLQVVESRHPVMVQGVAHWIAYLNIKWNCHHTVKASTKLRCLLARIVSGILYFVIGKVISRLLVIINILIGTPCA
ncbi:hypothetical protein V2J09_006720, partial [Rumex salicifolius]